MSIHKIATLTDSHFDDAKKVAYAYLENLDSSLRYHKREHTTDSVVPAALAIAQAENFCLEDILLVGILAAFHDTGFATQYNANEPFGAYNIEQYMRVSQYAYTEKHILIGKDAIENTNMKTPPQTKYAQVLRDADLAILGHPDFIQWNTDLMEECKLHPESSMHQSSLDLSKWAQSQLGFISKFHTWFTQGANTLYEKTKQQNIVAFKEKYHLE